jgi:8-oxo-dGTP diphosphatase
VTRERKYPERPVVGVGGVAISNGQVLLIRRKSPPLEGEWSIPGGMLEVGENLREAVKRELAEETGVDVRVGQLIEVFDRIFLDADARPEYHYVILDYLCEVSSGTARAGSDASEVAWAAETDLDKFRLTETATRIIKRAFEMARDPD